MQTPSTSAGTAKLGLGIVTSVAASADAGDKDGQAQADATVVALTLDKDGKILSCAIDAVQTKVLFDDQGQLDGTPPEMFQTKNELADAYGMKSASGIGKEWYEQAKAFCSYIEGMTPEDVKNMKVDETNHSIEPDLKASVTISIGGFMKGVEKAAMNAKEGGASEADKLGLGIIAVLSKAQGASPESEGMAQAEMTFAAVTRDMSGKISACMLDAVRASVSFTEQGIITTDLAVSPPTKNELKEAYGLKNASGIQKEWFEQAEAFAQYVTGKMPSEVAGMAVDDQGHAVAGDLAASVTIAVGDFIDAVEKATSGA